MSPLISTTRAPHHPALQGIVELLWLAPGQGAGARERVIPTGGAHLVWRIDAPIRLWPGQIEHYGVFGGPRSTAHVHHTERGWSVGVMLHHGAVARLTGTPAHELKERHTGLADLFGPAARSLQEDLSAHPDLRLVEELLVQHLQPAPVPHGIFPALDALERGLTVEAAALRAGCSTRSLRTWFHDHVGLSPVRWARVRRVRHAMRFAAVQRDGTRLDGAHVAHLAGFSDQAHLCRDFRSVTGTTMTDWRDRRPGEPSHVRVRD